MNAHTPIAANARAASHVDQHIGTRLRLLRSMTKTSQSELGAALGVTFQQIQKYERGTNRISASRLHKISAMFGKDMKFFFEGLDEPPQAERATRLDEDHPVFALIQSAEGPELVRALAPLRRNVLRRLIDLSRAIGDDQS